MQKILFNDAIDVAIIIIIMLLSQWTYCYSFEVMLTTFTKKFRPTALDFMHIMHLNEL